MPQETTINEAWQNFYNECLRDTVCVHEIDNLRTAFFSSAMVTMSILSDAKRLGGFELLTRWDALVDEIQQFAKREIFTESEDAQ